MQVISKHQPQTVLACRQCYRRFSLAATKMANLLICRQRQVQVYFTPVIDQKVMVSRGIFLDSSRCYAHSTQPKLHNKRSLDNRRIDGFDEIELSAFR